MTENNAFEDEHSVPFLQVIDAEQTASTVPVIEGQSLFAGSGAACGVALCGDVNSFHGMFSLTQGKLWVQDCNTTSVSDILLNGSPIEGETVLKHGDTLSIGDNEIVAVLEKTNVPSASPAPLLSPPPERTPETGGQESSTRASGFSTVNPSVPDSEPTSTPTDFQPSDLETEPTLEGAVAEFPADDPVVESLPPQTTEEIWGRATPETEAAGYENEHHSEAWDSDEFGELELLRSEIEYLQCELASRDAQLETLQNTPTPDSGSVDDADVERMANRLEELLVELQVSDERVRSVEDLLVASEEAAQAEQEERRQLESWLGEIEQRVSQRENELQAELTQLGEKYERARQLQQNAENQLREVTSSPAPAGPSSHVTDEEYQNLQAQFQQLSRELESSRGDCQDLKAQLDEARQADKTNELRELEQKLIRVELDTSRERADIARQRAELERIRDEMQHAQRQPANAADTRLAAMRQHLREIHEEEKFQKEEQRQKSLTGRIASLLQRP